MGLFDSLKNQVSNELKHSTRSAVNHAVHNAVNSAVNSAVQSAGNHTETVTLSMLPQNLAELQSMPQADLQDPYGTVALTIAALCRYGGSVDDCVEMLNYLRGPRPLSPMDKQFLRDRLVQREYVPVSYLEGTSPQNDYTPTEPYRVSVKKNPYSAQGTDFLTLYVHSSGADSDRIVEVRRKPSTGQWFLWEAKCLSDIRVPVSADPWA